MKKQSASTIKLYEVEESLNRRQTIEVIKSALISLGLKYVSDQESEEKESKKQI